MWISVVPSHRIFFLYKKPGSSQPNKESSILPDTDLDLDHNKFKKRLFCSSCKLPITFKEAEIEVNGKSHYTFFNPHGLVFDLTCFSMADGCSVRGVPTTEFSWFPGFSWQVSTCNRCKKHLGWMFSDETNVFFALILRELVE